MTTRKKLRDQLTKHFIPELRQRGFSGPTSIGGNGLMHIFSRPSGDGTQVLSLQFDKWQTPRFVLNLHIEPPGGMESLIGSGLTFIQGRVSPSRGVSTGAWFRADRPWWQRLVGISSTREQQAVSAAIATLDEIEQWWQSQAQSRNIRNLATTYRKTNASGNV